MTCKELVQKIFEQNVDINAEIEVWDCEDELSKRILAVEFYNEEGSDDFELRIICTLKEGTKEEIYNEHSSN